MPSTARDRVSALSFSGSRRTSSTRFRREPLRRVLSAGSIAQAMVCLPPAGMSAGVSGVEAVRRFNRFYTKRIGVLQEGFLRTPFSLTRVRVLYELAHRNCPTAGALAEALDLDAGYLSRILANFEKRGFVARKPSKSDGRQNDLRLTKKGSAVFAPLEERAREEVAAMLRSM